MHVEIKVIKNFTIIIYYTNVYDFFDVPSFCLPGKLFWLEETVALDDFDFNILLFASQFSNAILYKIKKIII